MSSLKSLDQVISAEFEAQPSVAAQPVTKTFTVSDADSQLITVDVIYTLVGDNGGTSFQIQSSFNAGSNWVDHYTTGVSAGANLVASILMKADSGDAAATMPMRAMGRVICNAGGFDSLTIHSVHVSRRIGS